ncbi:MAG TPA: YafY family protein [Acidobacteriaceae bacterium]|jgi:predicted DNA-binding transcriptional regulator YafY|nr:YafY family protein [Acidobacteriaceae bacterium]
MKSDRLLSALMLLQAQGRLSTRELAERLEVSQRTAHRDMEALSAAGVPILALRGTNGGWELEKGWRTKVPGLDEAELRALLMAQPSTLGDPRLIAAAERAFGKLMAAMPGSMRNQAASIRARLHIDPTGWRPSSSEDLSLLPIVQDAIARDSKLTFLYARPDGETAPRTVDPFGIVCKQAVWYLVARAPAGMRTYRISRMSHAVVLAVSFRRLSNFNLVHYWKASTAQLAQQRPRYLATVALAPEAATSLGRWYLLTPAPKIPHPSEIPADWILCDIEFESLSQAQFVALGLGPQVYVLAPNALRDRVLANAHAILDLVLPAST